MELINVLIIEDNKEVGTNVLKEFMENKVYVKHLRDSGELENELNPPGHYQLIILDWLLDGVSSDEAKLCLALIRKKCFIPVVVWSEEIDKFNDELDEVYDLFPKAYISGHSKAKIELKDLYSVLENVHSLPPMNLAENFRRSITDAVECAFFTLADHSHDDLVRGLKSYIETGKDAEVDIEHVIDVLLRLVGRSMYEDDIFINELRQVITELQMKDPPKSRKEKGIVSSIQDLHMYYKPRQDDLRIRTGDIVEFESGQNSQKRLAIVITPACDLAHPKKTMLLRLAFINKAVDIENERKKYDRWLLRDNNIDYFIHHHEILVIKNETLISGEVIDAVMSYEHEFTTLTGSNVSLERKKRLDEPYRADLLHHFVSHAGRIGVPEFFAPSDT